ncbi:hypothetical protein P3T25_009939 [Paraburkholderia sp. GAS32]
MSNSAVEARDDDRLVSSDLGRAALSDMPHKTNADGFYLKWCNACTAWIAASDRSAAAFGAGRCGAPNCAALPPSVSHTSDRLRFRRGAADTVANEGSDNCGYPTLRLRTRAEEGAKKRGTRSRMAQRRASAANQVPVISFLWNSWPDGLERPGGQGASAGVRFTSRNRNWIRGVPALFGGQACGLPANAVLPGLGTAISGGSRGRTQWSAKRL